MNFRRPHPDDTPEINLIPLIDVLLVILIFLAATTSFTRFQALQVALPQASSTLPAPDAIELAVSHDGLYAINGQLLESHSVQDLALALRAVSPPEGQTALIIKADAQAPHETVIRVMEAARTAGIERINFATQERP
ncbi:MAG: biopolymer transporter ExbD [Alcaligenaceae bacterium]|nr:biopolymer transporter ExbD [Alcaligenaceae bacterium]